MSLIEIMETLGESTTAALGGLVIGTLFGIFAQRSKFCLRSAVVEFARGKIGNKTSIWLLTFSAAVFGTQFLQSTGVFDLSDVRQLSNTGSISGALLGGLIFGAGMIMARGCSSRLLVLSATGNLRALLSGLIFAVTAQASLHGIISPIRNWITSWWTVSDTTLLNIISLFSLPKNSGLILGTAFLVGALFFSAYNKQKLVVWISALGVGATVVLAWFFNFSMAQEAFSIIPVKAITFTGPSADALMVALNPPGSMIDFDIGLVPGVFLGSFLAAYFSKELKIVGFINGLCMRRYIFGAMAMGFGGMLAGGCAVGAGVTGGSIFALTAWLALTGMWAGAALTDWLIDRDNETCIVSGVSTPAAP
ncbi:MAG TPA: YeeE/YedE family protein [Rhizobiales bacterium]|nr:YeeE/YedE family protein [Hyphomicrobiales bacterium]